MIGMVVTRVLLMKRSGIHAMKFGEQDKKDFLILPFALFYFYMIFAIAFGLPAVSKQEILHPEFVAWLGLAFCLAGLSLLLWSLISFGRSFRVGIDTSHPDKLVTDGVFAYSRNPIYGAFALILIGQFFIFSNWIGTRRERSTPATNRASMREGIAVLPSQRGCTGTRGKPFCSSPSKPTASLVTENMAIGFQNVAVAPYQLFPT